MVVSKADQEQVRALLKEAIMVLCRNGLQYKSGFMVEGILGITRLDDDHVFLVNINETVKEEAEASPELCDNHRKGDVSASGGKDEGRVAKSHPALGNLLASESPSISPRPPLMTVSGADEVCPSSGIEISKERLKKSKSKKRLTTDYEQSPMKRVRNDSEKELEQKNIKEEVMSDSEGALPYAHWPEPEVGNIAGMPGCSTWDSSIQPDPSQMALSVPQRWLPDPQDEIFEYIHPDFEPKIQLAIMKATGSLVMTRTICRRRTVRSDLVIRAMKAMTLPQGHHLHVGEYRKIGTAQHIFFKCPPELLHEVALDRFPGIDLERYAELYFMDPKPEKGAPINWDQYLQGLIRNYPYNPHMFPLQSMGLSAEGLEQLAEYRSRVAVSRHGIASDNLTQLQSPAFQGFKLKGLDGSSGHGGLEILQEGRPDNKQKTQKGHAKLWENATPAEATGVQVVAKLEESNGQSINQAEGSLQSIRLKVPELSRNVNSYNDLDYPVETCVNTPGHDRTEQWGEATGDSEYQNSPSQPVFPRTEAVADDRHDACTRPDLYDPSGRSDASGRSDTSDKPEASGRSDVSDRSDVSNKPDVSGRSDASNRPDALSRPDTSTRHDICENLSVDEVRDHQDNSYKPIASIVDMGAKFLDADGNIAQKASI